MNNKQTCYNYNGVLIPALDVSKMIYMLSRFSKKKSREDIFYNVCFCILVPQSKFSITLEIVKELKKRDFFKKELTKDDVFAIISKIRYRRRKVNYLMKIKPQFNEILAVLGSIEDSQTKRKWLVKNLYGLGLKTASHFLRNMGATDLAIIDTHILKFLKITGKWNYFKIEKRFKKMAKKYKLSASILDALIWKHYSGTKWEDFRY